jgi:ceramide glucosyltransferase
MSPWVLLGLGWAGLATGFSAVALGRLLRTRRGPVADTRVPVLLLRPVDAPTERELENLSRPVDYAGELEHVVVSPYRPRLGPGVRWLPSDPPAPNRKVGHLLYALEVLRTQGRVVLAVDADVAVTGALVAALAAPIEAGAALSTAAPTPVGGHGVVAWAVVGLLRHSHHSFRALHAMSAGAKAVCGKALGLSPVAARELRGLADHIGEDLELAKRLHARGARVVLADEPALVPLEPMRSWRPAVERFTRWMQVLSSHRPGLYPTVPLLFTPTLPLGGLAAVAGSWELGWATGALVLVRTLLSWRLAALTVPARPLSPGGWVDSAHPSGEGSGDSLARRLLRVTTCWLLGEALLLAAFLRSTWQAGTVTWRGRTYSLERGGRMAPVWPELSGGQG